MKTLAVIVLIFSAGSAAWSGAVLTAYGAPPEWNAWGWHVGSYDIGFNSRIGGIVTLYRVYDDGESRTREIRFWPPQYRFTRMSKPYREWLFHGDWNDRVAAAAAAVEPERRKYPDIIWPRYGLLP